MVMQLERSPIAVEPLPKKENVYGIATANILDRATVMAALSWRVQDHVTLANRSGYEGVELWPQGIRPLRQIRSGTLTLSEEDGILSAHQSVAPVTVRSLKELQVAAFLPETNNSLADLDKINEIVGDIPVVLFKETPDEYFSSTHFTTRGIQTHPEVCKLWGVTSAEEFANTARNRGFNTVVVDTHHIRRPNIETGEENSFADWEQSLPKLLPHTTELHIGIGRTDHGKVDPAKIKEEALDLVTGGQNNTEIVRMLRFIAESGWRGLVVVEMRPGIYKDMLGKKLFIGKNDLAKVYTDIRETLYTIFDK